MIELSQAMKDHIAEYSAKLAKYPKLQQLYQNCYPNTLLTTAEKLDDDTVFLYTGDIPAMWLRDSTAQVTQYISVAKEDEYTANIIKGLLRRQFTYINIDPYANAFNIEPNGEGHVTDGTDMQPIVYERKYEIDSLCYPMRLAFLYYEATGDTSIFDDLFISTAKKIVALWRTEQRHMEESPYRFSRDNCPWHDTIHNRGMGFPVNYTGMTWSGFRPSDDGCVFGYLVPSNLFAVVILRKLRVLFRDVIPDPEFSKECRQLASEIKKGVELYATVDHPKYGKIYACETDGFGNHRLFDDANVPSLLSLPYLGYCDPTSEIYANTRRFILSKDNPYYFEGACGKGIGSPHTGDNRVWHIALSMQGLTSVDEKEMLEILDMLVATDGGTGYMHESFDVDDDKKFSRAWFAWSNSLFAEFVEKVVDLGLIG